MSGIVWSVLIDDNLLWTLRKLRFKLLIKAQTANPLRFGYRWVGGWLSERVGEWVNENDKSLFTIVIEKAKIVLFYI